jgi:hypothetical protein
VADVRHDFVKTVNQPVLQLDVAEARRILAAQMETAGVPPPKAWRSRR